MPSSTSCADPSASTSAAGRPAETALAIMAEVVAERRGGTGRPLRERAQA